MPDEATKAPAEEKQETPESAAPEKEEGTPAEEPTEGSTPEPEHDFEKRYNDLRPEYDRVNQLVAAARGDHGPELQSQALQMLGLEMESEEDDEDEDDFPDTEAELQQIKEYLAQQEQDKEQSRLQEMEEDYIASTLEEIEKKEGFELSDHELDLVVSTALTNRLEDGRPDLQGAIEALKESEKSARERYVKSKKAPTVPQGQSGDRKIDLSDDDARREEMGRIMDSLEESE